MVKELSFPCKMLNFSMMNQNNALFLCIFVAWLLHCHTIVLYNQYVTISPKATTLKHYVHKVLHINNVSGNKCLFLQTSLSLSFTLKLLELFNFKVFITTSIVELNIYSNYMTHQSI